MKWWMVGLVIIVMGLFGWMYGKNKNPKPVSKVGNIPTAEEIKELNLPQRVFQDKQGKDQKVLELSGTTTKWNYDTGILDFKTKNGQEMSLPIDPVSAVVFTPSRKTIGREIMINSRDNIHWSSVFCTGDLVVMELVGNKVIFVSNTGYRNCGFKDFRSLRDFGSLFNLTNRQTSI
jgi:hypothetical protein